MKKVVMTVHVLYFRKDLRFNVYLIELLQRFYTPKMEHDFYNLVLHTHNST